MLLFKRKSFLTCCRHHLHYNRYLSASPLPDHQIPQTDLFLCNSRIEELCKLGKVEEARWVFNEMIQRSTFSWNVMINGYSRSGRIDEARTLFDVFIGKNVRTWTSMVTGYAKIGRIGEAREVFDMMPERNVVSWNAMVSGYVQNGDLVMSRSLFEEMHERDVTSWNTMITGYTHCGRMKEARELFDRMGERDLVTWMVMISGYVHIDEYYEAWELFVSMVGHGGLLPDQSIFVVTLSAIGGLNDPNLIESLRVLAIKTDYEGDVVVGTAILNAYTRTGCLDLAVKCFEGMWERNDYSWTTMIAALSQSGRLKEAVAYYERVPELSVVSQTAMMTGYAQNGKINEARYIFEGIPNPNVITWNAMITGYAQNGMLDEAANMFSRMPVRNLASWAAMISGFAQNGHNREALEVFLDLHRSGIVPSHSSFTSSLFACANIGAHEIGKQIHSLTVKSGCQFNPYVGNGLISMYAKCKNIVEVSQVFNTMKVRDTASWNSLLSGLSQNSMLDDARNVFEKMPKHDVVSWTAMISGYVQAGQGDVAFHLFLDMLTAGIKPNSSTLTNLLVDCGRLGATKLGKQIHAVMFKLGLDFDVFGGNSLITMYFKCGCKDGFTVFEEMFERDRVTWNAILSGCAQNGFGKEAVDFFEKMKDEGVFPDSISFVGVLCACSHAGLVNEGWNYFYSMTRDYGIMPMEVHYACMVDLLGRAGQLSQAEDFIEKMPIEPDLVVWAALLGACRIHHNVKVGRRVAEKLFQLEPHKAGNYVLLSNIYASLGMWKEVGEVRKLMRVRGVNKEAGTSWVQIKNKIVYFFNGDTSHHRKDEIYSTLKEFYGQLREAGYVPKINFVLHDVEEEQKENELLYHSEKLAIAYCILSTPHGTSIQIMKNLRICGDCHTFTKFMSEVTKREIIIRDGNRFHHFRDGSCSCGAVAVEGLVKYEQILTAMYGSGVKALDYLAEEIDGSSLSTFDKLNSEVHKHSSAQIDLADLIPKELQLAFLTKKRGTFIQGSSGAVETLRVHFKSSSKIFKLIDMCARRRVLLMNEKVAEVLASSNARKKNWFKLQTVVDDFPGERHQLHY
ncbi:hypothetical protein GIB67_023202 [Kingdonia uniflora]|uniref:DYW domain-containing protein n=1 Tax=Kingdonia uniflora TaxID=39325 RepID=A0A7J7MCP4_9MAGN|nr:hypothetical protein GIB67_023202 [Kingdonia uniflora]